MTYISSNYSGCDAPAAQPGTNPPIKRRRVMDEHSNDSKILRIIERASQFYSEYRLNEGNSRSETQQFKNRLWENICIGAEPDACEDSVEKAAKSLAALHSCVSIRTGQNPMSQLWETVDKGIKPFATRAEQVEASNQLEALVRAEKTTISHPQPTVLSAAPSSAFPPPFSSAESVSSFDPICPSLSNSTIDEEASDFIALQTPLFAPSPEPFPHAFISTMGMDEEPVDFLAPNPFPNSSSTIDLSTVTFAPSCGLSINLAAEPYHYEAPQSPISVPTPVMMELFSSLPAADEPYHYEAPQSPISAPTPVRMNPFSHLPAATAFSTQPSYVAPREPMPNAADESYHFEAPQSPISAPIPVRMNPFSHLPAATTFSTQPPYVAPQEPMPNPAIVAHRMEQEAFARGLYTPFFSMISKASQCVIDERTWYPRQHYTVGAQRRRWEVLECGLARGASEEMQIRAAESLIALIKSEPLIRKKQSKLWEDIKTGIASGASFEQRLHAANSLEILLAQQAGKNAKQAEKTAEKRHQTRQIIAAPYSTSTRESTPTSASLLAIIKMAWQCPRDEHLGASETHALQSSRWKALVEGTAADASQRIQILAARSLVGLTQSSLLKKVKQKNQWENIKKGITPGASHEEQLKAANSLEIILKGRENHKQLKIKYAQQAQTDARSSTLVPNLGLSSISDSEPRER